MKKRYLFSATASLAAFIGMASSVMANPATSVQQIDQYAQQGFGSTVSQVNSVSELTDVDPNSWAFQALKSVVERYGCLEGYPNKTYRGNRPLSRYEFAAGLNACLERVNELITASTGDKATKEDLATLQRLQEDFRNELAALRGRTDALEAKTKDIESKLFNVNSKLDASVVMGVTGGQAGSGNTIFSPVRSGPSIGDSPANQALFGGLTSTSGNANNVSFVARTSLNIRATFSGQDELLIRMRGVTGQDVAALFSGVSGGRGSLFYALGPDNFAYDRSSVTAGTTVGNAAVSFDKIRYVTNIFTDKLRVFIGPRIDLFEFIDTNSFANNEEVDFSSGFHINNPLTTFIFTGPGGGFDWQIFDSLAIRALYIAQNGGSAIAYGNSGLFGGSNIVATELEFNPGRTASIKLQYSRFQEQGAVLGTALGSRGVAGVTDAYGANAEWAVFPNLALFGRYGFANSRINGVASTSFRELDSTTWQAGLAIPFGAGNVFAAAYGQPIRVNGGQFANGTSFVPSGIEGNIETFIRLRVSDRLTITPDFQYIFQGSNISGNSGISIGTLRATFTF